MTERESEPGGTPVGGSRRPARTPRGSVPGVPPAPSGVSGPTELAPTDVPPSVRPVLDKLPDDACPWLYLAADPDARAAFVTAEHRCEIRPDEVPGPGHQLAYCLTSNHISCPQLRDYEARRRVEAESAAPELVPLAPALATAPATTSRASQPATDLRAALIGGAGRSAAVPARASLASRVAWAAAGAVGALALAAGLLLYKSPDNVASSEPDDMPESLPPTAAATPDPTTPLAAAPPDPRESPASTAAAPSAPATSTPGSDVENGATAPDESADAADLDTLEALSALGPAATDDELGESELPSETATATPEATPPPIYIVQSGDTLGQIAQTLGVDIIALAAANDITTGTLIFVGDQLQLPVGE